MKAKTIDSSIIPGAFWHQGSKDVDVIPARGQGSKVYDTQGREYIDYLLGSGPMILGHNHPAVTAALREQLERGIQFFFMTSEAMTLAEELARAIPCAEAVRYSVTGTEATFYALRFARAYTGREKILKFEGGYHGGHDYTLLSHASRLNPLPFPQAQPDSAGIPGVIPELVLVAPYNDLATTEQIIAEHAGELAAVILEPYQRYFAPQPGFLAGLREITRHYGILLIYDEIVTGFRLAYGGAQEYYGVVPDLAVFGKALGGGLPISAIVGPHDIIDLCDVKYKNIDKYVDQLGTFKGNPLAVVAALAVLEQLRQPGVYERLHALGARLRAGLSDILSEYSTPFRVYGEGPTFKAVFVDHDIHNHREALDADQALENRFEQALLRGGLFIRPGMRHYISLAHTDEDIERTLEIAAVAARETLPR
ncbi:MAG: aspartate aminotransferase family protein [Anaerolineae bacterium]